MEQPSLFTTPTPPAVLPPVAGKTRRARQASESGARVAVKTFTVRQSVVLQLLRSGPLCRQQIRDITSQGPNKLEINVVCSVIGALLKKQLIERTGDYDIVVEADGSVTKRERFRVRR